MENLPKDLINLLMMEYIDPSDAIKCLRLCNKFYNSVDVEKVIVRAVKRQSLIENRHHMKTLLQSVECELCGVLVKKKNYQKHRAEDHSKRMKHNLVKKCHLCDLPYPTSCHKRKCLMQLKYCQKFEFFRGDFERLCTKKYYNLWVHKHNCVFKCNKCGEIVEADNINKLWDHNRKHGENSSLIVFIVVFVILIYTMIFKTFLYDF